VIYGCYPSITKTREKQILLKQLYDDYINKDIIEILKVGKPDIMQQLITLTAHSSGQLINFSQLATDCKLSSKTIQNYLGILEKTFVIKHIRPFVGNKRKEVTSNPILYFIDNGFRNQALRNFSPLIQRQDASLLIEGTIFQEILKYKHQHFLDFDIHYWRTQSGAEIDFILYKNEDNLIPVEVKFRNMNSPTVTRAFRSFIDAYKPKKGIFITKDFNAEVKINNCNVHFISFANLVYALKIIEKQLS